MSLKDARFQACLKFKGKHVCFVADPSLNGYLNLSVKIETDGCSMLGGPGRQEPRQKERWGILKGKTEKRYRFCYSAGLQAGLAPAF